METPEAWEERIKIVRGHFERKGYRVHSGLQFGCELVLYADHPGLVHSDFCVHVVPRGKFKLLNCDNRVLTTFSSHSTDKDGILDWKVLQTLVRSMPSLHKTLILASVREIGNDEYKVDEIAMATEHAPFRHKKVQTEVGAQRKKQKMETSEDPDGGGGEEEGKTD